MNRSLVLLAWSLPLALFAPPPAVTQADVIAMMAEVPVYGTDRPGHFEHAHDAARIAAGIARAVNEEVETVLEDRQADAALLVVFGARESSFRSCASGDRGASLGYLQEQGARAGVACDPYLASKAWLWRARDAMRTCVEDPAEERLALLASGKCTRGRQISRERVELAEQISDKVGR